MLQFLHMKKHQLDGSARASLPSPNVVAMGNPENQKQWNGDNALPQTLVTTCLGLHRKWEDGRSMQDERITRGITSHYELPVYP